MTRSNSQKPIILIANGESSSQASLARNITKLGYKVRVTNALATLLNWVKKDPVSLVILDVDLYEPARNGFDALQEIKRFAPDCPIIALGGENTVLSSLLAARFGAVDFFARPYSFPALAETIANLLSEPFAVNSNQTTTIPMPLIDHSKSMKEVLPLISKAASSDLPVMIFGQPGTGKYRVANIIHRYGSLKKERAFTVLPSDMIVNSFNLSNEFMASSATTLIVRRLHRFSHDAQHLLCDWLDRNEYNERPIRIICTLSEGSADSLNTHIVIPELLGRLKVLSITMPNLRKRRDDIVELATEFLGTFSARRKTLSKCSEEALKSWPWPGNVRELKNFIAAVSVQISAPIIDEEKLRPLLDSMHNPNTVDFALEMFIEQILSENKALLANSESNTGAYKAVISVIEEHLLANVLDRVSGNQLAAAKFLGINRNTLRKKINEYDLARKR